MQLANKICSNASAAVDENSPVARTIVGLVVGVLVEAEPAFAAVRARCEARVTGREGLSDSQANAFQGAGMAVGAQWAGMAVGARSLQVRTSNLIGDLVARLELNRPEVPAGREGLADSQANAFQGAGMAVGAQWAGMAVGARSLQVRTSNLIGDLVARLELNRPEVPASRHMSTVSRAQFNQSN
jgi:hypothetical protein